MATIYRSIRIAPLIIWSLVIFFASSQGAVTVAEEQEIDVLVHKLAHVAEYCILYIFFIIACYSTRKKYPVLSLWGIVFVFIFGFFDEIHQSFTPTRSPKVSDAFVDLFGGFVGYILTRIYPKKKE